MDAPGYRKAIGMGDGDRASGAAVDIADCVSGRRFMLTDCTGPERLALELHRPSLSLAVGSNANGDTAIQEEHKTL